MAPATPPEGSSPWHSVHGTPEGREPVAPSKPAMPTTGSIPVVPQPIEEEDADVVAPVDSPPDEEIMPSARGSLWSAVPPPAGPPASSRHDPVRDLGDAALRNASLSASGAPTPLGGIPQVPSAGSGDATEFRPEGGAAAPRTAWFAGDPRADAPQGAAAWSAGTVDLPEREQHQDSDLAASPPANIPELADEEPSYTPPFGVAVGARSATALPTGASGTDPDATPEGDDGATPPPAGPRERTPWYRSVPFLVLVGLLVMGGIGYGLSLLFAPEPETVALTPEVIVEAPAEPTLDPIAIAEPTDFQAALPGVVGTYAMTGIESPAVDAAASEVRAAEVDEVVYSDGETELQLRAVQHYNAEDATAQFEIIAAEGTGRQDVMAGSTPVGQRATVPAESGEAIVWRNGTAVFVLTGPADALEDFYALFPL